MNARNGPLLFQLRKGDELIADEQGQDFPDVPEVFREALLPPAQVVIADEAGRAVETIHLAAVLPKAFKP